ncbi:uncharacterized protein LOC133923414 [Phragmites australis]|uniref:uncharacterized protein LOC133923414 n=1 Tax=Phragmites australis TaxID=29695 RepID=UPI002D78898A|nr:uncharacterized protein LOC133923414 [Phragmites australis]
MDPPQDQHGGSSTNPIYIEGVRSIHIPDSSPLKMSKPSKLSYYRGSVRSGNQSDEIKACDAIILRFKGSIGQIKYDRLAAVDHPCILKSLGYGRGIGEHRYHTFFALKPFETTFQVYVEKNGPGVDQNGRFTEDFIKLISNVTYGIEELHSLGYYCPDLAGDNIAVIRQSDSISAKLWEFRSCSSDQDKEKSGDWLRLGYLILKAADFGDEATDLFKRIKSGQLKGKSILKHSALLTVRKKFKNVLALYFHLSLNYQSEPNQSQNQKEFKVSDICAANLKNDLDKRLYWEIPSWVSKRCSTHPLKTLRGFITQLRNIIEHEVGYIPDEMTRELTFKEKADGKKVKDLEHHLQDSCGKIFWAVQMLVAELNLNS